MKRTDHSVSEALREVWAWKEAVYREVKDLPPDMALAAILDRAERIAAGSGSRRRRQRRRKSAPA